MTIKCKGKEFVLADVIEDVLDEYFNGDEDFITHFTMAIEDYMERKVNNGDLHS